MKKNLAIILVSALAIVSCKPEFDDVTISGGKADFSNYVAIGNSLTAGYADNALYKSGQENSYPMILATQMSLSKSNTFNQPYMADDLGGMTIGGSDLTGFDNKLVLGRSTNCLGVSAAGPVTSQGSHATEVTTNIYNAATPFNNFGVPGAKVTHLEFSGYGDVANLQSQTANPYFIRMASSPSATMLEDAIAANPTFFSLWIGNNDVLGYATSGGVDPNSPITNQAVFTTLYESAVSKLVATGAKGILASVPDVTSIPFFTTVGYDALAITDAADANNLTAIFKGIANYVDTFYNSPGLGDQYLYDYVVGPNAFLVQTPKTAANPLGIRLIKENELVLLSISQDAIRCEGYGSLYTKGYSPFSMPIDSAIARLRPFNSLDFLSEEEISDIATATDGFNATIERIANENNLAYVDMREKLRDIRDNGYTLNDVTYTTTYVSGGAFSLDGVHLTPRGYAVTANYFIEAINAKYEGNLPKVNVNNYPGLLIP